MAPIDERDSISIMFCMSTATPALVSVCLVSLFSPVRNLLFEAYLLLCSASLMCLYADHLVPLSVILFHYSAILVVCFLIKRPVLRPILELILHPVFHIMSQPHVHSVHTSFGALPEGLEIESDAISGFQHSACTSSPLLAAFWTLLVGKKCRCHIQIFDLLLVAAFSLAIAMALCLLILLLMLLDSASWLMFLYPIGCLLAAICLALPYIFLNHLGIVKLRKSPLCASAPLPFVGILMFLSPMLTCACITPFIIWVYHYFSPLDPVVALNLTAFSLLPPYFFVCASPQAFRPLGWILFLCLYFWSNLKVLALVEAAPSDASMQCLFSFIPLYAFLQSLSSRYSFSIRTHPQLHF